MFGERIFGRWSRPSNKWGAQKEQLLDILNSDTGIIMHGINEAVERSEIWAPVSICSENVAALITRIFKENNTFLISHLRTWAREKLRSNIEERDGNIIFTWSDPALLAPQGISAGESPPRYGDEV